MLSEVDAAFFNVTIDNSKNTETVGHVRGREKTVINLARGWNNRWMRGFQSFTQKALP